MQTSRKTSLKSRGNSIIAVQGTTTHSHTFFPVEFLKDLSDVRDRFTVKSMFIN